MSPTEPLPELLARFTPKEAGLDRDALLFEAGRASVRPSRTWQALAGFLAATQTATLLAVVALGLPSHRSEPSLASAPPAGRDAETLRQFEAPPFSAARLGRSGELPDLLPPEAALIADGAPATAWAAEAGLRGFAASGRLHLLD